MPVSNKVHVQKDEVNAQRVMDRIEQLATFSSMEGIVTRAYLTDEHKAAHRQLGAWMEEAGLQTWQDEVGNQWGRLLSSNPTEGTVIIGSHSDTVVNAGKYDGTLGVIMAIEALSNLKLNNIELPFHVDVVAFADEEGTRFNTMAGYQRCCWYQSRAGYGCFWAGHQRNPKGESGGRQYQSLPGSAY
ncbi:M28 family peptidase [Vibrio sp. HA2012]|uniref:M28 family peptidase n=1 Tax=Vibrio sp. HA2012 TaxID=1971595 RepID=UPI001E29E9C7|nr:M28 family peptidase [Vibrio sp. HA2012]